MVRMSPELFNSLVPLQLVVTLKGTPPCASCLEDDGVFTVHRETQYVLLCYCRKDLLNEETAAAYIRWVEAHRQVNQLPYTVGWAVGIVGVN